MVIDYKPFLLAGLFSLPWNPYRFFTSQDLVAVAEPTRYYL